MMRSYLDELRETWDLTIEELNHIKKLMACYAVDALHDSHVATEARSIADES